MQVFYFAVIPVNCDIIIFVPPPAPLFNRVEKHEAEMEGNTAAGDI